MARAKLVLQRYVRVFVICSVQCDWYVLGRHKQVVYNVRNNASPHAYMSGKSGTFKTTREVLNATMKLPMGVSNQQQTFFVYVHKMSSPLAFLIKACALGSAPVQCGYI